MGDYNLNGLSAREFEHVIQALATKVIGAALHPFGDGPDGGREATFEGRMTYPTSSGPWIGYLVIQAKFKQRSAGLKRDMEWLLTQLRKELRHYSKRKTAVRRPEYYILATNLVLTPMAHRGGKDRILDALAKQCNAFGIRGFDVWDFDKIRVLLDNNADVRRRYAPFISSGDVLSEVISAIAAAKPRFDSVTSRFLQRELRADLYVKLEQAGYAAEDQTALAQVFVDLPVATSVGGPEWDNDSGFLSEFIANASRMCGGHEQLTDQKELRLTDRGTEPTGRFVLVGGPGQGKTTMGQFICQLHRAALLKDRPRASLNVETHQALDSFLDQCRADAISLPSVRRFPVRVVLSHFAADLATDRCHSLLEYIALQIAHDATSPLTVGDLRDWLRSYPWLVVLDGLDEVPATSNRKEVLKGVSGFWDEVAACSADVVVLATTRPQGYDEDFSSKHYLHRYLLPLSVERALAYAKRLVAVRFPASRDRRERVLKRLQSACNEPGIARLMRSPLQITIMALLVDRFGEPPRQRWNLFHRYYEVMYDRELERDIPTSVVLRENKLHIDVIHHRVGLRLQLESESAGGTEALLSRDQFRFIVRNRLEEVGYTGAGLDHTAKQITDAAMHRLVFLVAPVEGRVGFEIRSLQEFMAAEELMTGNDDAIRKRFREIAMSAHWRSVFLLAAGKCQGQREYLVADIVTLVASLNESSDAASLVLMGSRLAVDLLEDGVSHEQPNTARALARIALRLIELAPDRELTRMAGCAEDNLSGVYVQEIRSALASPAHEVSAWVLLVHLVERGWGWARELADEHWTDEPSAIRRLSYASFEVQWTRSHLERAAKLVDRNGLAEFPIRLSAAAFSKSSDVPAWLRSALYMFRYHRSDRRQVQCVPVKGAALEVSALGTELHRWRSLAGLSFTEAWEDLAAFAEFHLQPSAVSLGKALDRAAMWMLAGRLRPLTNRCAWPLRACLEYAPDSASLGALAARARGGELGDAGDWYAAEKTWLRDGIRKSHFEFMATDSHWPFDLAALTKGFPFGASEVVYGGPPRALFDVFVALPSGSRLKRLLADVYFGQTFDFDVGMYTFDVLSLEELRELVSNVASAVFASLGLIAVEAGRKAPPRLLAEVLDMIGRRADVYFPEEVQFGPLTQVLEPLALDLDAPEGILRLLALTVAHGAASRLTPNLVRSKVPAAELLRVVLLAQSGAEGEIVSYGERVAQAGKLAPDVVRLVVQTIESHRIHDKGGEKLLMRLSTVLGKNWRDTIVRTLLGHVRMHKTSLLNHAVRTDLLLPKLFEGEPDGLVV